LFKTAFPATHPENLFNIQALWEYHTKNDAQLTAELEQIRKTDFEEWTAELFEQVEYRAKYSDDSPSLLPKVFSSHKFHTMLSKLLNENGGEIDSSNLKPAFEKRFGCSFPSHRGMTLNDALQPYLETNLCIVNTRLTSNNAKHIFFVAVESSSDKEKFAAENAALDNAIVLADSERFREVNNALSKRCHYPTLIQDSKHR
jgi:hypothetical protein